MTLKKKIVSLPTKITSIVSAVAPVAGVFKGFMSDPMAEGRGLSGALPFIMDRLSQFKIANPIITTQLALQGGEDSYPIVTGIAAAIAGYAIKEVGGMLDIPGKQAIKNMGNAGIKFGTSMAISATIAAWIWLAPFNDIGLLTGGKGTGTQVGATTSGRIPLTGAGQFITSQPSRGGYAAPSQ